MKKLWFIILFWASIGHATDDVITAYKLLQPINFDGWVEEEEWGHIPMMHYKMQLPDEGGQPTQLTEARIAYDDDFIYVSGRLYDDDAANIMANTKKRDALSGSTQFFGIILDSYNDNENALAFFTTPTGLRWDGAVANDAVGRDPMNISCLLYTSDAADE